MLERKLKEETEKKDFAIKELEKDIEITLQSQIQENEKLKQQNNDIKANQITFDNFKKEINSLFHEKNISILGDFDSAHFTKQLFLKI